MGQSVLPEHFRYVRAPEQVIGDPRVPDTISQPEFATAGSLATSRLVNKYAGTQRPLFGRSGRWLGRWAAGGDPAQNIRFGTP